MTGDDLTWAQAVDEVHGREGAWSASAWDVLRPQLRAVGVATPDLAPEAVDLRAPLGPAEDARLLAMPLVLSEESGGQLSPQARLALLQAVSRAGLALRLPEPGPDLLDLAAGLEVPVWAVVGPRRTAAAVEAARGAAVVELQLADVTSAGAVVRAVDALDPGGSLTGAVRVLRHLSTDASVWVNVGPSAGLDVLTTAVTSGADGVLVQARSRASPLRRWEAGPDAPAAVAAARRAIWRAKLPEGASAPLLAVSGGFKDGREVAKALALGADLVVMATAPRVAMGCELCGRCGPGECPPAPKQVASEGWRPQADAMTSFLGRVRAQAAATLCQMGCASARDAALPMLEATSYDAAATTGAALAGYGEPLPMWRH